MATRAFRMTPEYQAWRDMLRRCYDPKLREYPNYGGRGITVCERWRENVHNFIADMGYRPPDKSESGRAMYSLDRIDNNRGYEPSNCRWSLRSEQDRNTTRVRMIEFNGKRLCLSEWAKDLGYASVGTLHARLKRGLPLSEALAPRGKKTA